MRRAPIRGILCVAVCLGWTVFVVVAALHGFWRPALTKDPDPAGFAEAAQASLPERFRGNLVLVVLDAGRVAGEVTIGPPGSVPDRSSVFQIASLSKWVTAAGVLALVDRGLIDLDDPVEAYLAGWRFPDTGFDTREVTVRRLLSHTSGLTDGLGYNGFEAAEDVQTLEASLNEAADAMEGAAARVGIGRKPGRRFAYSGGGYTVLQMMIEDVTGQPFARAMDDLVLGPAEMRSSSFDHDAIAAGLAPILDEDGAPAPHRFYTALAAASLYSTADDLAAFLAALGRPREQSGLLSAGMRDAMAAPEAHLASLPIWGLGATIYLRTTGETRVIGHDGRNFPAINTAARRHMASGDGIVVLATGTDRLASQLADAWVYWRTGRVALTSLERVAKHGLVVWLLGLIAMLVAIAALRTGQPASGGRLDAGR